MFPVFSGMDDFRAITILVGRDKIPYIKNDKVYLGVTAYYRTNTPDLMIEKFGSVK